MKKKINIVMLAIIVLNVFSPIIVSAKEMKVTNVNIPDANLKTCINTQLKKPVGSDVSSTELESITELSCANKGIKSIEGLEYAKYLNRLNLTSNQISDISPIAGNAYSVLELDKNQISDVSGIGRVSSVLNLSYNQISDISKLTIDDRLKELRLIGNQISDISALKGTNIDNVDLRDNQISDLSPLSGSNTTVLQTGQNPIEDLSPLSGMSSLETLSIKEANISDISPLKGLTNLENLYLDENQISDISALSGLTNLKEIGLTGNQVANINALSGLPLVKAMLALNGIADFSPVRGVSYLFVIAQTVKADLGDFKYKKDIPTKYDQQITKANGSKYNVEVPIDVNSIKSGENTFSKDYDFNDNYKGSVEVTLNYTNKMPVFSGVEDTTIEVGDSFDILNGVTANDEEDGDLTSAITTVDNGFDNSTMGEYTVTYSVTDSEGNKTTVDRKITVGAVNEKPVFSGVDDVEVNVNDAFDPMQGVSATDKEDGDLTSKITVDDSKLQLDTAGEYTITYSVTDSGSQKVTADRKVTVINEKPVFAGVDDVTVNVNDAFDAMAGVTATDKEDGDLTSKITVDDSKLQLDTAGEYTITYSVTDSASETVTADRKVTVIAVNEKPVFAGVDDVTVNMNDAFDPMQGVSATDKEDGDLTSKITVDDSKLQLDTAGEYTITYSVTDSASETVTADRKVTVVATVNEKPVFSGVDDITLSEGDSFDPMQGVSAIDKEDGDLTSKIKVFTKNHREDKMTAGEFTYYYSVTDGSGDESKVERKVTVTSGATNEKPVIDGINDVTLNINDAFDPMEGVTATDKEDGDLTSKLTITDNNLDTAKVGSYKITYSVTDSDGNKTDSSRNINVVDNSTTKPSKPGDGGDITPMKPGTDDKDNALSKTGSNMLVISLSAIAALLLIKKSYNL